MCPRKRSFKNWFLTLAYLLSILFLYFITSRPGLGQRLRGWEKERVPPGKELRSREAGARASDVLRVITRPAGLFVSPWKCKLSKGYQASSLVRHVAPRDDEWSGAKKGHRNGAGDRCQSSTSASSRARETATNSVNHRRRIRARFERAKDGITAVEENTKRDVSFFLSLSVSLLLSFSF